MIDEKPYRLPDPEKAPEAFLVLLYKTLKRIEYNDRGWDKIYFARCMKRTKQLLENVGNDVQKAARCLQDLKERFEADGLSWTIETVVQYCFEWRAEHERRSDEDCVRSLTAAYAGLGSNVLKPEPKKIALAPAPDKELSDTDRQEALQIIGEAKKKLREGARVNPIASA